MAVSRILVVGLFMTVLLAFGVCEDKITKPPVDTVVVLGSDAQLHCAAQLQSHGLTWTRLIKVNDEKESIFFYFNNMEGDGMLDGADTNKFHVDKSSFTLTIKAVTIEDAGRYTCNMVPGDSHTVNLIVVETPTIFALDLMEGMLFNFTCEVRFGAPLRENMDEEQMPFLNMYFNEHEVIPDGEETLIEGSPGISWWKIKEVYSHTINDNFDKETFTCEAQTLNPLFRDSVTEEIFVKRAVKEIHFEPDADHYEVGEDITCKADGYPEPSIHWQVVMSNGPKPVTTPVLVIEQDMIGENEWKCVAQNNIGSMQGPIIVDRSHSFTIVTAEEEKETESDQDKSTSSARHQNHRTPMKLCKATLGGIHILDQK